MFEILTLKLEEFESLSFLEKQNLVDKIKSLISFLILVPDSPDMDQFHLIKILASSIDNLTFNTNDKSFMADLVISQIKYYTVQVNFPKPKKLVPRRIPLPYQ